MSAALQLLSSKMEKRTSLKNAAAIFFVCATQTTIAQTFQWAKVIGDSLFSNGYRLNVDAANNVYVAGFFDGVANFGNATLTSAGHWDILLAKYTPEGRPIWARRAGGGHYDTGEALAIDGSGENIFVAGFISGRVSFEDTSITGYPFFIANYNSEGNLKWVRTINALGGSAPALAVDRTGNVYMSGSADVDHTVGPPLLKNRFFILKFNPSGEIVWIKGASSSTGMAMDITPVGIAVDREGNTLITGTIQNGTVWFDSTIALTPIGETDIFVVKYDPAGNVIWVKQAGGPGLDVPNDITIDPSGDFYLTGSFGGTALFDRFTITSAGDQDFFLAKYEGGVPAWIKSAGGVDYDKGASVCIDPHGNVYATGNTSRASTFEAHTLPSGIFAVKYNSLGEFVWMAHATSTVANSGILSFDLGIDGLQNVYLTGRFNGVATFGELTLRSAGAESGFIAKLSNHKTMPTTNVQEKFSSRSFYLAQNYPNPFNPTTTISYSIPALGFVTLKVFTLEVKEIQTLVSEFQQAGFYTVSFKAGNLPNGLYLYSLQIGSISETQKMLLLK